LTGGGSTSKYPPGTTISVDRIHPHRRTNATTCPGTRGIRSLGPLRSRTNTWLGRWARPATMRARLTVWRPSTASWQVHGVSGPVLRGLRGDVPVTADFDGDGTPDLATWTPAAGRWSIRFSATREIRRAVLGSRGHLPVPADLDGDGRAELMTWDPATGRWHRPGRAPLTLGRAGDVPVPGDYTGDGRADLAVWRPATGGWLIRGGRSVTHGESDHVPVPADYDGDGDLDPATWEPDTRQFHVRGRPSRTFGAIGGVAVPGQYDGDAAAELAVWRPVAGRGRWWVEDVGMLSIGTQGDQPIPVS
jgi:hypothetical protein